MRDRLPASDRQRDDARGGARGLRPGDPLLTTARTSCPARLDAFRPSIHFYRVASLLSGRAMATRVLIDHRAGGAFQADMPPGVQAPVLGPLRHPEKAHRPDNPIQRKPAWIRVKAPTHAVYAETRDLMRQNKLVTVCEEAACPNIGECWSQRHATMMIMGDTCTRACSFCNVADRAAGAAGRARARPRRGCGRQARPAARRRHLGRPRRSRRRRRRRISRP